MTIEHPELYRPLFNFLFKNHLCIAVSDALLIELSKETRSQTDFNTFFTILPSAKIKSFEAVIEEEIKSYPKLRTETLLRPTNSELGKETITSWLISNRIKEAQRKQLLHTKKIKQYLESVKSNFPPSNRGKYNEEQAEIFTWMVTVQWLKGSYPDFMKKLNDNRLLLTAEVFPSIQLFAYYVYHKHYLNNRQPKELPDIADLLHMLYFPYCKLIIVERDLCNILNQIKSRCNMLDGVEVRNADFFRNNLVL